MVACNHHGLNHDVIPGSMGWPMPGYRMVVVDGQGHEVSPGEIGQLAMDSTAISASRVTRINSPEGSTEWLPDQDVLPPSFVTGRK